MVDSSFFWVRKTCTSLVLYKLSMHNNYRNNDIPSLACTSLALYKLSKYNNYRNNDIPSLACTSLALYKLSMHNNYRNNDIPSLALFGTCVYSPRSDLHGVKVTCIEDVEKVLWLSSQSTSMSHRRLSIRGNTIFKCSIIMWSVHHWWPRLVSLEGSLSLCYKVMNNVTRVPHISDSPHPHTHTHTDMIRHQLQVGIQQYTPQVHSSCWVSLISSLLVWRSQHYPGRSLASGLLHSHGQTTGLHWKVPP